MDVAQLSGWILEVDQIPLGSVADGDHAAGSTTIAVADAVDFDEDGGMVLLGDATIPVEYTGADLDADEIVLATPLSEALDDGDAVSIWDSLTDSLAVEVRALVEVDNGDAGDTDPVEASVAFGLVDRVPLGDRGGRGEVVHLQQVDGGEWKVADVQGTTLKVNGSSIDPGTLPQPVPIEPPTESPVLTVTGMPDTFLLRTEPIAGTTWLTFSASEDGGVTWAELPDMPVRSTIWVAKSTPGGGQFLPETDYQFRVLAGNAAGDAPAPSAAVTAQLDLDAVRVVASEVIASEVIAGFLLAGRVEVGGDTFTLSPPGLYPDDADRNRGGLRIELTNGDVIHLPADGSEATIAAHLIARSLNVVNGAELSGQSHLGGQIEIGAGIPDPTNRPVVSVYYESVAPAPGSPSLQGLTGLCRNAAGTGWLFTESNRRVYQLLDTGALSVVLTLSAMNEPGNPTKFTKIHGITKIGGTYFLAANLGDEAVSTLEIVELTSSFEIASFWEIAEYYDWDPTVAIGSVLDTDVLVAFPENSKTVLRRYAYGVSTPAGIMTLAGQTGGVSACFAGSADFGSTRWLLQQLTADVKVFNATATLQPSESWPRPMGYQCRGLWWDGTHWWSLDNGGRVRRLESVSDAPAATYWLSYAWVDGDTHTTGPSPQQSFTRPKRARISVTASPAPKEAETGTHVPNRIRILAATSSGGSKYPQGAPLPREQRSATLAAVTTAGTPAAGNNWSGVTNPGVLAAEFGGFTVDGNSDGAVGSGSFAQSIRAFLSDYLRDGRESITAAANTVTSVDVEFDTPMKATPRVVCSPYTATSATVSAHPSNETVDGFTINFKSSAAGSWSVNWIASAI